ncbi:MAG: oxidoreductase [Armatimonadetes bacterium CG_4_10_14_3_um_filter_66_18]|nr:Gfo/Idh/MocA family oxidoreductase [Armatimonadota bacterium]PIU94604.1 MAG: oxidoreductase [Armatimonadetes bacterium CG06_land_8_20_14_3_00_66_21]PIX36645.1 MAG: oxidoreductase [Armatimonadetes bacterium CG_4_8_14_3_um_filter_66_20]PIY42937.1 MAG: oxidoreductase [Armatimonadetes bacterium CG_4_10_14_3_um_filter_66_18]PIZ45736.1 MAG: oxidoreductase [Armatimonadetes bacterium CG_4_10_14_0_8_um_filter_66_14]PJB62994.1 MAG: oxidoreductase [Armatimonadetes bacterium CG_4_9_14_3_um_filter_66_14
MEKNLTVVLAGCGGMSRRWLEVAAQLDCLEVVGLVDLNEEAAKGKAADFGLPDAALGTDLAAVLDSTAPDLVFDCTVPEAHVHVTLEALKHGCHVMGEKPLADSMENARKMVAAAQEAGKLYAVIQNRRYDPRIRRLSKFLASGALGRITTINSDFYLGAHFGGFRDRMEHVLLLDMAIHTFDQARLLTGADPVGVYCKEWNPAGSWYDHDASAMALFDMTDGLVYNYRGSWCAEGLNTSWECDWRILCERGSAKWDGGDTMTAQVVRQTGGFMSEMEEVEIPPAEPAEKTGGHEGLIREFVHCVQTGDTPETICSDNIKSLAMVFGAIESAEAGRAVEIAQGIPPVGAIA